MGTKLQTILAKNLKRARAEQGISQAVLAERVGISTTFIGELEISRKFPSLDTLENIATALQMEPYELLLDGNDLRYSRVAAQLLKDTLVDELHVAIERTINQHLEHRE